MKHIFKVVFFLIYLPLTQHSFAQLNTVEIYKRLAPSVVTVVCYDNNGHTTGQGTGFAVDSGLVLINRHTMDGAAIAQCRDYRHNKYQIIAIVADNDTVDLVLVRVAGGNVFGPPVKIAQKPVEPGEPIAFVGCPQGLEFSMNTGIISSLRYVDGEGDVLQLSSEVAPGASGSPIVNMNCELVGIGAGRLNNEHSVNFAIPAKAIGYLNHHAPIGLREWSRTAKHIEPGTLPKTPQGMAGTEMMDQQEAKNKFIHAKYLYEEGKYSDAGKEFEWVTQQDINMVDAWYYLGLCEEKIGHPQHAFPAFEKAGNLKRNDKDIRLHLAGSLMGLQQFTEAYNQYQEAVRIDSGFAEAWLGMAQAALATGNQSLADDLAHRAENHDPNFVSAYLFVGQLRMQQGRNDEAEKILAKALDKFPDNHHAAETMAYYYLMTKDYPKAEKGYVRALELDPKCAASTGGIGACLAGEKKFDEAQKQYLKAISMSPGDPGLHFGLAEVYASLDKPQEQISEYKKAIELNPSSADAHLALGLTAFRKFHDMTMAIDEYKILKGLDAEKAHQLFSEMYK